MKAERSLFPVTKKWGTQKGFMPKSPTGSCSILVLVVDLINDLFFQRLPWYGPAFYSQRIVIFSFAFIKCSRFCLLMA